MLKCEFVRAQDRLPGNISQWHTEYPELKLLVKQLLPEGPPDPPLPPWVQEVNLPRDRCPPHTRKTPFTATQLRAKTRCLFSNLLLCLTSSLMSTQALLTVLSQDTNLFSHLFHALFTHLFFFCLKSIKRYLVDYRASYYDLSIILWFSHVHILNFFR